MIIQITRENHRVTEVKVKQGNKPSTLYAVCSSMVARRGSNSENKTKMKTNEMEIMARTQHSVDRIAGDAPVSQTSSRWLKSLPCKILYLLAESKWAAGERSLPREASLVSTPTPTKGAVSLPLTTTFSLS